MFISSVLSLLLFQAAQGSPAISPVHRQLQTPSDYGSFNKNVDGIYVPPESRGGGGGGDALFVVGNAYIGRNNLTDIVKNMIEHSTSSSSSGVNLPLQTQTWDVPAAHWQHYAYQLASNEHAKPEKSFEEGLRQKEFRWVVLQEQSEVPGLYQSKFTEEWIESNKAVQVLDDQIQKFGNFEHTTQTILFQTWGRLHFDDNNAEMTRIYDNFSDHQYRIASGYREFQKAISKPERQALIAPVGFAFETIYDSLVAEGLDPEQGGSKFANLYDDDGSHPSAQGSYLAASVLVGVMTGQDPRQFDWSYPVIDLDTQKYLREVAHQTLVDFCQICNVRAKTAKYVPPEERGATSSVTKSSSSGVFGKFISFVFWCGVLGGCGFVAWKKQDSIRATVQSQLARRRGGTQTSYADMDTSGAGNYAPLQQGQGGLDMELI
ncbi:unnamed protein product [Cylindrotheca closterium]|uniref:SGNH hydrolase-type esterase domain-containing protein n=1 Tax=Cylindrotheca closterium TaxID=2856 RepID=A0AAD2G0T7_9STRA|nr:unnamed protein product [Cylindrotheca closterium]